MSKILSVCHRRLADPPRQAARIERILHQIAPDMLRGRTRVAVRREGSHLQGALNLPDHFPRRGLSLCQGKFYDPEPDWAERWWAPGSPLPDGSYALIRDDADRIEAAADPAASRTLWYYFDDEIFAVSNAQRAITMYAGRFDLDPAVGPWMLSTGSLGPGNSWNRHLRALPPSGAVTLDKSAWTLDLREDRDRSAEIRRKIRREIRREAPRSRAEHLAALETALAETIAPFDARDAAVSSTSLSGGVDSRAIACLLRRLHPQTVWKSFSGGPKAAPQTPGTDAAVAAGVAARIGAAHRFIETGASPEPIERRIARFILCGEGRIDHLGGYLDGMALLAALNADGTRVILRGDHGFGWRHAASERDLRRSMDLMLCRDIAALAPHLREFGLDAQRMPDRLARGAQESLATWRDRLYHEFRIPTVLAALTEIKTAFVDVLNPLLSRRALDVARALPDDLRTDKALFRDFVRGLGPDLPFADVDDPTSVLAVLRRPEVRRLILGSLRSDTARRCFGAPLTQWLEREIDRRGRIHVRALRAARLRAQRYLGGAALRADPQPDVHPLRLGFRLHIARVMIDQLSADAAAYAAAGAPAARAA